jgi:hypothetical protein
MSTPKPQMTVQDPDKVVDTKLQDDLLNLFEQQTSKKSTGGWSHKK